MILGVLSDTHDRYAHTRKGIELLRRHGAEALIHCGDLCSQPILDLLAGDVPSYFVFGNNDWDREGLERDAKHLGVTCLGMGEIVELGGKRIAVAHGDVPSVVKRLLTETDAAGAPPAFLLSGHTHRATSDRVGKTWHVNPGALHRTNLPSVALIDLARDAVRIEGVY